MINKFKLQKIIKTEEIMNKSLVSSFLIVTVYIKCEPHSRKLGVKLCEQGNYIFPVPSYN